MESPEIQYPAMRAELVHCLKKLSDIRYQEQVWVKQRFPENVEFDGLDLVIHFIYDDTALGEDAASLLGVVLEDEAEVAAIGKVVDALNALLERYGTDLPDKDYLNQPEWLTVVEMAGRALAVLGLNSTA